MINPLNVRFVGRTVSRSLIMRVSTIAEGDYWLRRVCPSAWNNTSPNTQMFIKFNVCIFFENL